MLARHLDGPEVEPQGSEFEIGRVFAARGKDDVDGRAFQAFEERREFLPFRAIGLFGHDHGAAEHRVFIAIIGRAKIDNDRESSPGIFHRRAIVDGSGYQIDGLGQFGVETGGTRHDERQRR